MPRRPQRGDRGPTPSKISAEKLEEEGHSGLDTAVADSCDPRDIE